MELTEKQIEFVKWYLEYKNIKVASEAVGITEEEGLVWYNNKDIRQFILNGRIILDGRTSICNALINGIKYSEKFRQFYNQQFKKDFSNSLKLLNNYTESIAPKEKETYNIFFSTDWQTDLICRRYVQIEEVMQEHYVFNKEDLERRLSNSDKLGETLEKTEGLSLEVIIELVKDLNYIWVIDPKEENDSFGQPVEIPTRDITVDFEHKELVVYNECDNEEWYRFPFEEYKKTWWLKNDTPITAVEDSNRKE